MLMSSNNTAQWLRERDNFLVFTHQRPDGDALGSAAGLCQGLRDAGKTAFVLPNPEATKTYIEYVSEYYAPESFECCHVVTVDTASEGQFQINAGKYLGRVDLCIDHHPSNTGYAGITCLESDRAACGEIVYDILSNMDIAISPKNATALYVALATDTGCFCYGNTNSKTLITAAKLIELGVQNGRINKELFRTKSKIRLKLEAEIISQMEFYSEDTIGIATLTQKMLQHTGARPEDIEDIAALPGQVQGVNVAVTLQEQFDGTTKISVRTSRQVNANDICQRLGGGGHSMAAGCRVTASPGDAKIQILKVIEDIWVK